MIRKSPHRTHRDERYFEIRCAALEVRVRDLEAALRQIAEKPTEDNEWDGVDKYRECQEIAAACFTKGKLCEQ